MVIGCALLLTAGQATAQENPFAPAIAAAESRTVKIYGAGIGRSVGYASGLIVSAEGEILTAQGVFLSAGNLRVTLPDGSTHPAEVVRKSDSLQLALLKIDAPTTEFFALHGAPVARQGDWILAVSNAFKVAEGREPLSVNVGVLSLRTPLDARRGVQDFPYEGDVYLLDAITSNPGAAGGAVVNAQGELVGMIGRVIEGKATGTRLNYAVPADLLREFLAGQTPPPAVAAPLPRGKGELGIRLFALGGRRGPAYIDRILPGSAAATSGLKSDDLIVTLAGQVVHNASDFRRIAETLVAGEAVVVEVKRKDQLLTVRLVPGEQK